jgi:hypothetical protein
MKARGRITLGLLALTLVLVLLFLGKGNRARQDLERTRLLLRQQGFKIDLRQFDLSLSPDQSRRAVLLARTTRAELTNRARSVPFLRDAPRLLTPVGSDAAPVVWKLEALRGYGAPDLWPELREIMKTNHARLDAACRAALSGPFRFEPIGSQRLGALLPYLADLKDLVTTLGIRAVLALRDGDKDAAWTNLLASTCLVTAYEPEPIEAAHLVRFACATLAYNATWNVVQSREWTDADLAELQHRWQAADFWSGLAETAAHSRADMEAFCQEYHKEALNPLPTIIQALHSPWQALGVLEAFGREFRYWSHDGYEDEEAVLLYYRDREIELRRAMPCSTWAEMRQLPGVTNFVAFKRLHGWRITPMLNTRQLGLAFLSQGHGLLGRAAETETRRRLITTGIALERYRGRHGSYPGTLQGLVPELLQTPPIDFMDGQPLRYRLVEDGHFVLYSVGLDCVDDGGQMRSSTTPSSYEFEELDVSGPQRGVDLVWPRPASRAEVEILQARAAKADSARMDRPEEMQAAGQWLSTASRQARVESIFRTPRQPMTNEPSYRGRPLREVLRNERVSGTNQMALADMLTLKQVVTGEEPEIATFEMPLDYDVLTHLGHLGLEVDPIVEANSDEGCEACQWECKRATNGNCLLVWNTIYETPGNHALQAGLLLNDRPASAGRITGPLAPFAVTNLGQFSLSSAHFEPETGATFLAQLPEPNGTCIVELKSPIGEHLNTLTGSTSNGVLKVHWDLTDDHGHACTNDSYGSVFHITLPDSGRSQTLRGP